MKAIFLALAVWIWPHSVGATDVPLQFDSAGQEQHYWQLLQELRCLVCQNQSLADSHAELAQDMRERIYDMIQSDYSHEQIIDHLVSRYGNFVRYRPPLDRSTYVLWFAPALLILIAAVIIGLQVRRHAVMSESEGDEGRAAESGSS